MRYTTIDVGIIVLDSQPQPNLCNKGRLGWQPRPNQHQAFVVNDILAPPTIFFLPLNPNKRQIFLVFGGSK